MSSQGLQLLLAIFWILMSKNDILVVLTVFLNNFQSLRLLDSLYLLRDQLQSSFHHFLECFVMLTFLTLAFQAYLVLATSKLITCSKDSWFKRFKVLRDLMIEETSLMNASFLSLFFGNKSLTVWTNSSSMKMVTVRGAWSEVSCQSRWITWLLSLLDLLWRNIRSITKSNLPLVSEYLVETGLVGSKRSKLNELASIKRSLLMEEWWGKEGSHNQSLILKSPVIMSKLLIFTSVFLRYFKVEWEVSE